MTVALRILQAAEYQHDLALLAIAGLGALGLSLAVIAYTAWSTP